MYPVGHVFLCVKYGAIEFHETPQGKKARVNSVLCKGDGLCNPKCPTGAIYLKHFTDEELLSQIDALFGALVKVPRKNEAEITDRVGDENGYRNGV